MTAYVGGGLAILQNYHLGDLGGIGPIVVPVAGSFVIQRQPQGAACCPAPVAPYVDTYTYCANTCPLVGLGGTGGFEEALEHASAARELYETGKVSYAA